MFLESFSVIEFLSTHDGYANSSIILLLDLWIKLCGTEGYQFGTIK